MAKDQKHRKKPLKSLWSFVFVITLIKGGHFRSILNFCHILCPWLYLYIILLWKIFFVLTLLAQKLCYAVVSIILKTREFNIDTFILVCDIFIAIHFIVKIMSKKMKKRRKLTYTSFFMISISHFNNHKNKKINRKYIPLKRN